MEKRDEAHLPKFTTMFTRQEFVILLFPWKGHALRLH